jgi:membrane-associated protease RseP (regulator of RpoE activity)
LKFSLSVLFILICHEMGHYIACRIYRVDATLPYFIPTPPMIGPAGTFGAFIKILSPLPSRRAVFDIGVAGPIAGFVALVPVAILGFLTYQKISRRKFRLAKVAD